MAQLRTPTETTMEIHRRRIVEMFEELLPFSKETQELHFELHREIDHLVGHTRETTLRLQGRVMQAAMSGDLTWIYGNLEWNGEQEAASEEFHIDVRAEMDEAMTPSLTEEEIAAQTAEFLRRCIED
jgi:hypothetical protein